MPLKRPPAEKGARRRRFVNSFKQYDALTIDWELSPEDAVTLYLEWGNNDWRAPFPPVRSRTDYVVYFVVDSWTNPPKIRLLRRNSERLEELAEWDLPENLAEDFAAEYGTLRGVFQPTPAIREWLKKQIGA